MKKIIAIFIFGAFINLRVIAQKHISTFLSDMGIKSFKINSTLNDLDKIKSFKENLTYDGKTDNESSYMLRNGTNIFSATGFSDASFSFKDDTLKKIAFEKIGDLSDGIFEKTYNELKGKYGEPLSFPVKNTLYRRYEWNDHGYYLVLKPLKISFLMIFGEKFSKSNSWIYKDRKGKGVGLVKLNLNNWEQLVNLNLRTNKFEKYLANWQSTGSQNHIQYDYDKKTRKWDIPQFVIRYKLNDYDIETITKDTSSKIISEYKFLNFKDRNIVTNIKNDLIKSNYKIDNDVKDFTSTFYYNAAKKTTVMVTKDEESYSFKIFR